LVSLWFDSTQHTVFGELGSQHVQGFV
jgi:hypothetical protein